ncbi:hypothetical protein BDQ94DRAFT_149658 [Aspergillus welwitschiae]|uniref:Uncharacterized protein n=1 Tax=Aspergillus welwitschiae TaxID=1341132 RepID=A0A3F3PSN0_9EURO|nr:hypothetical protein BDQ94DRAFT_149658 [Aspergillus welwitschiae]RDH29883.1 hypothetical protein BDQ94DRAFT_149658 [Aspergillus welwitschiae]
MVNVTIDVILLPPPSPKQPHGFERMGSKLLPASLSEKGFQNLDTKGRSSEECARSYFFRCSVSGEYPSYSNWCWQTQLLIPPIVSLGAYLVSVTLCLHHRLKASFG